MTKDSCGSCGCGAAKTAVAANETIYRIENMDCPNEEKLIRARMETVQGVQGLQFDLPGRTLKVTHTPESLNAIEQALAEAGTKAQRQDAIAERAVFRIENMDCRNEEAMVRKALEPISGVRQLEFDLPARTLTLTHSLSSLAGVEQALTAIGMKPERMEAAVQRTVFQIDNMDCRNEEALVRKTLEPLAGVQQLEFDLPARRLVVTHSARAPQELEADRR